MTLHSPRPSTPYGRFAIFIDGSNFYHTIREIGLMIDYRRLLAYFQGQGTLVRATYYTPLLEHWQTPDWLIRLMDWLAYNGFHVVTKTARLFVRQVVDEEGTSHLESQTKGNTDIEIAVDMMSLAPHCDTMILFSGDGDFQSVVQAVQRQGCRVIVISSSKTSASSIADELRRQADAFIDLSDIASEIRMPER
jgi:uncharacterized LabA/DUF88 family protein